MDTEFMSSEMQVGPAIDCRRRARKAMVDKRTVRVSTDAGEVHPLHYKVSRRGVIELMHSIQPGPVSFEWVYVGRIGRTRYRNWTTRDAQRLARRRN